MATELIKLLRPHVRFNVSGPIRPDWREAAPAHVDVVGAMADGYLGIEIPVILQETFFKGEPRPILVAGIDFGGALIAAALAGFSDGDFPARYVRKESWPTVTDGVMRTIHQWSVIGDVAGQRIVAVDDVATTGGALMCAISALREAGAIVEDAIVVVDREDGADALLAGAGVRLRSLVTLKELAG